MKKILFALFLLGFQQMAHSQYYYKDLVTTRQTNDLFNLYRKLGIKKITLNSYDGNSTETAGFTGEQVVDLKKRTVTTITRTSVVGDSWFTATYDEAGRISESADSAQNASNKTKYEYDASGRLSRISATSISDNVATTETHSWQYDGSGKPVSMTRIINNSDTTQVQLTQDEKGNVGEERAVRKNLPPVTVFYYHDNQSRLTDVVRYNAKAKRLLPDYMFEYNDQGQVKKMTVIPEGTNEYQNWYYQYQPDGLKRMDLVYNKQQQLMGKVEYEYVVN
ncbi:hypothetical protein [Flavihumibacter solisilvae]|jgi:YD repeat-containing protein|uniref:YD repeat-containing protein n=1 Tax=Flavihumibacter solisilvae TaxID=1349421 RepID=A0A0C1KZH9_9BACT|nr:hypothetical protein [Flavihumibacter solisilvae]KIC93112.1 hypothetical protein OI18_18970 [Flavihumibacter solisilvae]